MSELPSTARTEVEFQNFLEQYEDHDIGLDLFDERIVRLTANANEDGGSFSELIEPGIEDINDEWLYHEELATITGRLYLLDGSIKEILDKKWGEADKDEQGRVSYFVSGEEVRSFGIIDTPHGDRIDKSRIAAKIGYGFTLPDPGAIVPQLVLYPGEASQHIYALPTPEAIDMKLHSVWPDAMEIVDTVMAPKGLKAEWIPRRLAYIARKLQPELADSSELRQWLGIYINGQLKLDAMWPYKITAKNQMYFLDDEYSEDWAEMGLDKSLVTHVRKPRIEFVKADSDDAVKAVVFAELPDVSDEWKGTPVGFLATDIEHMRGTRVVKTIIDHALAGYEQNVAAALAHAETEPMSESDMVEPRVYVKSPHEHHHGGDPENILQMKRLCDELQHIIEVNVPIAQKQFETFEQAREVSNALTQSAGERLIDAGIIDFVLRFEGEYALRANTMKEAGRKPELGEVIIRVDPEQPFRKLMHGDNFTGIFYAFQGDVVSTEDDEGKTLYYQAAPRMIVDVKTDKASALDYLDVSVVEIITQQRGVISLDGTVAITIPSLSRYEADKEARAAAIASLGRKHPISGKINRLFEALMNESDDKYQRLGRANDVRAIARHIEANPDVSGPVFEALSSMFMNRSVELMAGPSLEISGVVSDVSMHTNGRDDPGPHITVLESNGEYYSLRMSSLTLIRF